MKSQLTKKMLLTFCALVFGAVVPYLEINATHVFNPAWPSHARLHEVWQLATNSMIALYCLWKIWGESKLREAAGFTLLVTGGFFIAWILQGVYGGSMLHADGTEKLLLGMNMGVFGFGLVSVIAVLILVTKKSEAK